MKCPNDGAVLTMSERSGVEIDYCPECRGVWLDRGELDKILDRAAADIPAAPAVSPPPRHRQQRYRREATRVYTAAATTRARGGRRRRSTGSPSSSTEVGQDWPRRALA